MLRVGEFKLLTVVSPEEPDGVKLLLEPNENPAAKAFQQAIYGQGILATAFFVAGVHWEYERMRRLGVVFRTPPTTIDQTIFAVFDDTCGNLIRLDQG